MTQIEVKVGQIRIDNDNRIGYPRHLLVETVIGDPLTGFAECRILSGGAPSVLGKSRRISLSRFRPTASGYRLKEQS